MHEIANAKIVITGHNGFLGRNLIERLPNATFLKIGREHSQIDKIQEFQPDYIFHFGAEIYDESKMIESNIIFTHRMLEAVKDLEFKAFIHCGSSSEYGQKDSPMSEWDVLEPRTMYEATKGACTLMCQAYSKMYDKPIAVVRPFSVYGRYEKEHRFIPTLFRKFEEKQPIRVSPGNHDFIHIDDFIDGILLIVSASKNKIAGQVYNLGTGVQLSNYEVVEVFSSVFGYQIPIEKVSAPMRSFDTNNWVANIYKSKKELGFFPKYTLEEGIKMIKNKKENEKFER